MLDLGTATTSVSVLVSFLGCLFFCFGFNGGDASCSFGGGGMGQPMPFALSVKAEKKNNQNDASNKEDWKFHFQNNSPEISFTDPCVGEAAVAEHSSLSSIVLLVLFPILMYIIYISKEVFDPSVGFWICTRRELLQLRSQSTLMQYG